MKKASFLRLMAVMVGVCSLLACGGGDGDGDGDNGGGPYDFSGRWAFEGTVTNSNVSTVQPGQKFIDVMSIVQDGNNVTVSFVDYAGTSLSLKGTCDPAARTFNATGATTGTYSGGRVDIAGAAEDSDSMSGTLVMSYQSAIASLAWSADLVSRTLAVAAPGGNPRGVAGLLKAISN